MAKMYSVTIKNRVAGVALALGLVGVGALVLFLGFALLATLVVGGTVLGTGVAAYRWLRGGEKLGHGEAALDPALEVRAPVRNLASPPSRDDDDIPPPS